MLCELCGQRVTCIAGLTQADELVNAVSAHGAMTTRIARTLVEIVLAVLTCTYTPVANDFRIKNEGVAR